MARYLITVAVNLHVLKARALTAKISKLAGAEAALKKPTPHPKTRRERFDRLLTDVASARDGMEELKDEMESWADSIPENLQGGDKAQEVNDAVSQLEDVIGSLDAAIDGEGVDFPSMR